MAAANRFSGPRTRKTRIVCISDTHKMTPALPKGDVLIHAGDMTNQGSLSELQKTVSWLEQADFEARIVVAGNHDITLDSGFYAEHGRYFHNQQMQDPDVCLALLRDSPSITYLMHSSAHVKLRSPNGPRTHFRVFGSPFSPAHGLWAFDYQPDEADALWDAIPLDTQVLVTHTPPKGHCDTSAAKTAAGCEALRRALWRVRPMLHVCGHKHEGRGVERVTWDLRVRGVEYGETNVVFWDDPGREGRKQSLVDLTSRGGNPLKNVDDVEDESRAQFEEAVVSEAESHRRLHSKGMCACFEKGKRPKDSNTENLAERRTLSTTLPQSLEAGVDTLVGRAGRQETCIVNAAHLANSWGGPKRFNKPIVVDIDLPVWHEGEEGEEAA